MYYFGPMNKNEPKNKKKNIGKMRILWTVDKIVNECNYLVIARNSKETFQGIFSK